MTLGRVAALLLAVAALLGLPLAAVVASSPDMGLALTQREQASIPFITTHLHRNRHHHNAILGRFRKPMVRRSGLFIAVMIIAL